MVTSLSRISSLGVIRKKRSRKNAKKSERCRDRDRVEQKGTNTHSDRETQRDDRPEMLALVFNKQTNPDVNS